MTEQIREDGHNRDRGIRTKRLLRALGRAMERNPLAPGSLGVNVGGTQGVDVNPHPSPEVEANALRAHLEQKAVLTTGATDPSAALAAAKVEADRRSRGV